jgi:nitroreductase family protein
MSYPNDIFARMFSGSGKETLLYPKEESQIKDYYEAEDILQTNIFNIMLNRRSQRKFEDRTVEDWKVEMIFAAADTAPTAGGFQGFEIYNIKNDNVKNKLVVAANNQPYVKAPIVLVFYEPWKSKDEFSSTYNQEVFTTGLHSCSSLLTVSSTCPRLKLDLDRNDRRIDGYGSIEY